MKFALVATVLSVTTSISPMFSSNSSTSLQNRVMQLQLENYVLKTGLVQLHVKVDELIEQHKETQKVIQALNEKTIFDEIYKEFDRVYDRAASFFTTTTTVNNVLDNDVASTTTTTRIPSKSAYYKEEQLAPPEPPNHDVALLLAARSCSAGSSPPQRTSSIQEQSSIANAVAATMLSLYSMISPSTLLEQVVDFVYNVRSTIHDLALLLTARSSSNVNAVAATMSSLYSMISPSALLEQVVDFVHSVRSTIHDLALLLAARSCSTGSSPPQRTSSVQEQSSILTAAAATMSSFSMVSPSSRVLEHVVNFVRNVPSTIHSWYYESLSYFGHEILAPAVFYLEEQWGVPTILPTCCIAAFLGGVLNMLLSAGEKVIADRLVKRLFGRQAVDEMPNLGRFQDQLRQPYIEQVGTEMDEFLERVKAIFGITDLHSATKRQVEKHRNKRRLVHHPDKGGSRPYYDFMDQMMDFLDKEWFSLDQLDSANLWELAEISKSACIKSMRTCRISELPAVLAGWRPMWSMPSESQHLQLSLWYEKKKKSGVAVHCKLD
jgi:hypothetical protein